MAQRVSIGQYVPSNSALHRMDPRVKLIAVIAAMVGCFFIQTPRALICGYMVLGLLLALSHLPLRKIFASIRPIIIALFILSIFNLFVRPTGIILFRIGFVLITTDGLWAALLYTLRLIIALILGALLLLTTTPTQLTDALDALFTPLTRLGLPGHELALTFSLMLRFIPTLADEAQAVMDAQAARGAGLQEGSLFHRIGAAAPVVVSLFASSMHHATGLARALDARCYEGGASRSHWHPLRMRPVDWLWLLATGAYVWLLILLS